MKRMTLAILAAALVASFSAPASAGSVSGYYKKNGTYVAPHHRSNRDSSRTNNWSHKGNTNPYTGKRGTRTCYSSVC